MLNVVRKLARRFFAADAAPDPDQARLYADEQSCALAILSTDVVQDLYRALHSDPESIKARLRDMQMQGDNPDIDQVLRAGGMWHQHMAGMAGSTSLEMRLLIGLFVFGSVETREALTPSGGQPGDIPFFVAHKQREAELRCLWPALDEQTGKLVLLNDPFSPMEAVVSALEASFGLDRDVAIEKMIEVHKGGSSVLEIGSGESAHDCCGRLNSEWRGAGIPLYCVPQRLPSATLAAQ